MPLEGFTIPSPASGLPRPAFLRIAASAKDFDLVGWFELAHADFVPDVSGRPPYIETWHDDRWYFLAVGYIEDDGEGPSLREQLGM